MAKKNLTEILKKKNVMKEKEYDDEWKKEIKYAKQEIYLLRKNDGSSF